MKRKRWITALTVVFITFFVNVLAWNSRTFCDFYVRHIFPVMVNIYGRITGMWSFSVGEVMIAAGIVLLLSAVVLGIVAVIFLLLVKDAGLDERMKRFCRGFYRIFIRIAVAVFVIMTSNCFILYHCSTFGEKYLHVTKDNYSIAELTLLRDYVVKQANDLAKEMPRDERGDILYADNMEDEAVRSMQRLGEEYGQLSGYYPKPKEIHNSEFLSQQKMQGYYFPFSMEANYNSVMAITNKPSTMCHELAHVKGFIYEDEANLIGYLACIGSEDPVFRYSGYLSVLNYIDRDFYESIGEDSTVYKAHVRISKQVKRDNVFLTEEAWEEVDKKAVISTQKVAKASDAFVETSLVLNGIEDGASSYCRVVGLMLDYYDGESDVLIPEEYLVQEK